MLAAPFALELGFPRFPSFMSSWGLGGVFNKRSAIRRVGASRLGFLDAMSNRPHSDEVKNYIPEPYMTAIGEVCVNWGMLESVMDVAIAKFTGLSLYDSRGAILTAHLSWPQKMNALEALVNVLLRDDQNDAKFEDAKPFLKKAQDGRNRIVHGQWGERDGKVHRVQMTARGKLKSSIETITLEDIHAVARDIGLAGVAILKLIRLK